MEGFIPGGYQCKLILRFLEASVGFRARDRISINTVFLLDTYLSNRNIYFITEGKVNNLVKQNQSTVKQLHIR